MVLTSIDDWLHAMRIYEGFAVLVAVKFAEALIMARKYKNKNYRDFVHRVLRAVPACFAQPLMRLTSVLELQKKSWFHSPDFVHIGTLISLCEDITLREEVRCSYGISHIYVFLES